MNTNILPSPSSDQTVASAEAAAQPPSSILLVGEEFSWLPPNSRLAGRPVTLAHTKEEALALVQSQPFDGLIAGLPEIGKNLVLVNAAMTAQPQLACGLRVDAAKVASLAVTFPVIPSTQSVEVLDDLVRTMLATARWNADPAFIALRAQIHRVPSLPALYTQITEALQNPDTSLEDIAGLVSREPAVCAKVLQIVNSPIFGLRQRVTSVRDAANYLGVQRLRALVLSTSLIGQCDASRCEPFVAEKFESHGLQIADWAARITTGETRDRRLGELAFTAGLLHQFGVLLLAANLPGIYDQVLRCAAEKRVSIARVEHHAFGVTHAELAAFLLASWNIPFSIVNAVGFHPVPSRSGENAFSPLTAVHLATAIGNLADSGEPDVDRDYLERLHLMPRLEHWSTTLAERHWPS